MKTHDLFKASSVMALGTIFSRITGFVRGVLAVAVLGTALLADAYNVANTMPNILFNLLVGGALTAIFVPQLVRSFGDEDGGITFASRLVTTISAILFVLVGLGIIFAPALVQLYAPEFSTPGFELERHIAITFTRYCLPQIFFLGLFTMLGQVANSRGSFAPMMWSPIANNLVVIAIFGYALATMHTLTSKTITENQISLLGWGTTAGIIVQALIMFPVVRRAGIRLKFTFGLKGLGKSFALAAWTLLYVLISQIGYLITVNVATSAAVRSAQNGIATGVGFTPYSNAYLIMLLPYSIVTISIVTALLPHLSRLAIAKKIDEVKDQLVSAIKIVGVATIPSAVAFFFFGPLITPVLFLGIALEDARYIGLVLSALSFGLVAFSINLVLIRGFNAFEDTKTQVISIFVINVISVGLSYIFLATLKSQYVTIGLGAAFSVSYIIGLFVTLALLKKHVGKLSLREFLPHHLRVFAAALLAMLPVYAVVHFAQWSSMETPLGIRALRLTLVLVVSGVGYIAAARALGVKEISALGAVFSKFVKRTR